jgi:hypothetical protein
MLDIRFWREGEQTAFEVIKGDRELVEHRDITAMAWNWEPVRRLSRQIERRRKAQKKRGSKRKEKRPDKPRS